MRSMVEGWRRSAFETVAHNPSVSSAAPPIHLPIRYANREETRQPPIPYSRGTSRHILSGWLAHHGRQVAG